MKEQITIASSADVEGSHSPTTINNTNRKFDFSDGSCAVLHLRSDLYPPVWQIVECDGDDLTEAQINAVQDKTNYRVASELTSIE